MCKTGGKKKSCKPNSEGVCVYKTDKKKKTKANKDSSVDAEADFPVSDYTDEEKQMLASYEIYEKYVKKKDDKDKKKTSRKAKKEGQ